MENQKIYQVWAEDGDYCDRCLWTLCLCESKRCAQEIADALNTAVEQDDYERIESIVTKVAGKEEYDGHCDSAEYHVREWSVI